MVGTVSDGWQVIVQLLDEEVATRGLLAQSALEVLQLTKEVEVWGNGRPALFHKPVGMVQVHSQAVHDVGYSQSWRTRDSCCTVNQHRGTRRHGCINEV